MGSFPSSNKGQRVSSGIAGRMFGRMESLDNFSLVHPCIDNWLSEVAESEATDKSYRSKLDYFVEYCQSQGKEFFRIVDDFRELKFKHSIAKEVFIEEWEDMIRGFKTWMKRQPDRFASLHQQSILTVLRSFMNYWRVPINVELPRHAFVTYHNRDIKKDEIRLILNRASTRDKVIFLMLAESGMRPETICSLKYWQLKEDFEAKRVPMRILMPASELKDAVGDRWTFIGEDGFTILSEYLATRSPLGDDDNVFLPERQCKDESGFDAVSVSAKFGKIVRSLNIAQSFGRGKPSKIRLYSLRKYFRNNMNVDYGYREFWMAHTIYSDAHYISRDVEQHRKLYSEGYKHLRVYSANPENMIEVYSKLEDTQTENKQMRDLLTSVAPILELLKDIDVAQSKRFLEMVKDKRERSGLS